MLQAVIYNTSSLIMRYPQSQKSLCKGQNNICYIHCIYTVQHSSFCKHQPLSALKAQVGHHFEGLAASVQCVGLLGGMPTVVPLFKDPCDQQPPPLC